MKRSNWKDQRKYPVKRKPLFSVRIDGDLLARVKSLAEENNTTQTAITEFALNAFLDQNDPQRQKPEPAAPAGADLFD